MVAPDIATHALGKQRERKKHGSRHIIRRWLEWQVYVMTAYSSFCARIAWPFYHGEEGFWLQGATPAEVPWIFISSVHLRHPCDRGSFFPLFSPPFVFGRLGLGSIGQWQTVHLQRDWGAKDGKRQGSRASNVFRDANTHTHMLPIPVPPQWNFFISCQLPWSVYFLVAFPVRERGASRIVLSPFAHQAFSQCTICVPFCILSWHSYYKHNPGGSRRN